MPIRLFVETALPGAVEFALPAGAARHAQVRRIQPGDTLRLFDGGGVDWDAEVLAVGRSEVRVRVGAAHAAAAELPVAVTLALGMPANERMDVLVEKATELGIAAIQPLMTERSVLRLSGERAQRKQAHWQAIAQAACEQCGRARVPTILPVRSLADWLPNAPLGARWVLSLRPDACAPAQLQPPGPDPASLTTLSGPEGGLTPAEEDAARAQGFIGVALGARVLRADTAPLALLAWLGLSQRV